MKPGAMSEVSHLRITLCGAYDIVSNLVGFTSQTSDPTFQANFIPSYASVLSTLSIYVVLLAKACLGWFVFTPPNFCEPLQAHHAMDMGALPTTWPYMKVIQFQCGGLLKRK